MDLNVSKEQFNRIMSKLTQLTRGGNNDADIATPMSGPTLPTSRATATPVPDVKAHNTPIQSER